MKNAENQCDSTLNIQLEDTDAVEKLSLIESQLDRILDKLKQAEKMIST